MVDSEAMAKTVSLPTKSSMGRDLTPEEREERIALYAQRVAVGQDIWTGKPRPTIYTEPSE